ncbi:integrase core domain-containing protein [Candidatus Poriferisodalis sp.]|uniref:integrase core domain-containing protein n=1 Tax=Candidatus Poriferisodalis sp. TaxID=3101277 RepID=UPI003C6EF1D3
MLGRGGGIASWPSSSASGPAAFPQARSATRRCTGCWPATACPCRRSAPARSAGAPGRAKKRSSRRSRDRTGCGRPTSRSSRPTRRANGTSAESWTAGPRLPRRARSASPRPPLTRSSSSKQPLAEAERLLGISWTADLVDPDTGETRTLRIVTDNGPCFKSGRFAAWVASKGHIAHIRTRNRAPWTNGVIERFFGAVKYEHLYRRDITDSLELAAQVRAYHKTYNTIRPHQAIAMARPIDRYRQTPTTQPPDSESVSDS